MLHAGATTVAIVGEVSRIERVHSLDLVPRLLMLLPRGHLGSHLFLRAEVRTLLVMQRS